MFILVNYLLPECRLVLKTSILDGKQLNYRDEVQDEARGRSVRVG